MGKWSKLPVDLLNAIEDHVVLYIDKVKIRAVSLEWNSYLPKLPDHRAKQIPFLLHPLENDKEATHGLFNPLDDKIYKIYIPEARVKLFKGSSYGWIVTVEDFHSTSCNDIYLINPITRAQIKLPPRTEFADVVRYCPDKVDEEFIVRMLFDARSDYQFVEEFIDEFTLSHYDMSLCMIVKVVLSSAPNNDECVVIAIYGQSSQLAWCKCNDKKWTHIYAGLSNFIDILYSKSYLYALTGQGLVFMFENIGTELDIKFKEIATGRVPIPRGKSAYLAECSDGSLIVVVRQFFYDRSRDLYLTRTKEFKVYKFLCNPNSSWVEVKSIGDDVLFVGFGSVRSISSSNFIGCKRNHIYFSDSDCVLATFKENKNEESDVGVFNLEDGTVEPLQGLDDRIWPRPIWININ